MNLKELEKNLEKIGLNIGYKSCKILGNYSNPKINLIINKINILYKRYSDENSKKTFTGSELRINLNDCFDDFFNTSKLMIATYKIREIDLDLFVGDLDKINNILEEWKIEYSLYQNLGINYDYNYYDDVKTRYFLEGKNIENEEQLSIRKEIIKKISVIHRYSKMKEFYNEKKKIEKEYTEFLKLKQKFEKGGKND